MATLFCHRVRRDDGITIPRCPLPLLPVRPRRPWWARRLSGRQAALVVFVSVLATSGCLEIVRWGLGK